MYALVPQRMTSARALVLPPAIALLLIAGQLDGGPGPMATLMLCAALLMAIAAIGALWAGAAALPLLALLGGGELALAGWTAAGCGLGAWLHDLIPRCWRTRRELREQIETGVRDRDLLAADLRRYPDLLEACLCLAGVGGYDDLASELCTEIRRVLPECVAIQVHLGSHNGLHCQAEMIDDRRIRLPDPDREVIYVAREQRSYTYAAGECLVACLPLRSDRRGGRSGMPDATERKDRGVLVVAIPARGAADAMRLDMVEALARLAGLTLASVDLRLQARSLALRDSLTGLYGQHEFLRRLDETVARDADGGIGLVMCDMDHLKQFNDNFGHAAGDRALTAVAAAVSDAAPEPAICCRYGGEEFAILLPECSAEAVAALAEDIHQRIAQITIALGDQQARVSASLGWAVHRDGEESRELLKRADAACYAAKQAGRDRVVAA